jgi:hypothetical protein
MVRQGDVALVPVTSIPEGATVVPRDKGRLVLAYGEATGHAHVIDAPVAVASLLTTSENERFLRLVTAAPLVHEEHARIEVAPGLYRQIPQEEWSDSMEPQRVID